MKLLSFIIPVYNSQEYLGDCLKSLISQNMSYDEYEIICIDDGSTDKSCDIIKEFQKNYPNITLFSKENSGVSDSRNLGLDKSKGKYIWFVDSDDLIKANCLGFIQELLLEHNPELIYFNSKTVRHDYAYSADEKDNFTFSIQKQLKSLNNVWSFIIRSDIIKDNNIRFVKNLKYGEDTIFNYHVYIYRTGAAPTLFVDNVLYYYRQHSSSAMHHKDAGAYDKHVSDLLEMAHIYSNDYKNGITKDEKKHSEIKMREHMAVEGILSILPKSHFKYKTFMTALKKDGLYPYPMMWWKIKHAKGLKLKIDSFYKLFFKFELFYKLYYWLCKRL